MPSASSWADFNDDNEITVRAVFGRGYGTPSQFPYSRRAEASALVRGRQLLALVLLAGVAGCTRSFFRKSADNEVDGVLTEKDTNPLWKIEQYHVYPDARSRWADPSNPDRPPMPPDDHSTFALSPHPQQPGKSGVGYVQGTAWLEMIKTWDKENRDERKKRQEQEEKDAEEKDAGELAAWPAPGWDVGVSLPHSPWRYFPRSLFLGPDPAINSELILLGGKDSRPGDTGGVSDSDRHPVATFFDEPLKAKEPGFLLKLEQSVELGVLNSRQYQTFREELYEAALPVTQQRFNFAFQWAAGEDFIRQWAGPNAPTGLGAGNESSSNSSPTPVGSSPVSTPEVVPGSNNWTGVSTVGFSKLFVTGALLTFDFVNTNVWNFVAPKGFTSTSTVDLTLTQPLLQGGGKAVTLEPLTLAERTLFYSIRAYARFREQFYFSVAFGTPPPADLATAAQTITTNPISTLAALGIASTDVAGGFVSYLSTLYRECDMACDKKLVRDLERALRIYEGYQEGGQFSPLQVDQVRSTLLQAQNNVLTDQQFVTNAVDQFKLVLGLPANLPLILEDTPARDITSQLDRYYAVITDSDAAYKKVEQQEDLAPEKLRAALLRIYTPRPAGCRHHRPEEAACHLGNLGQGDRREPSRRAWKSCARSAASCSTARRTWS